MSVDNFIGQIWAARILNAFQTGTALVNTATEYSEYSRSGNVIHVTEFNVPTIVDYAVGTSGPRTIDPEDLTDSGLDIALSNEKAFGFLVDDVDEVQAAGSMDAVTGQAVNALIEDAESYVANLMLTSGTNGDGATATVLSTGDDAFNLISSLRRKLSDLKAPLGGRTLAVNPAFSEYLLGADSKLSEVNTSGSAQGLRDATIGRLLGFNVVESPLLNPTKATCVAFHESAIGWASQIDKVEALRDPKRFADIVRGLHVYGGKVLRPEAVLYYKAA